MKKSKLLSLAAVVLAAVLTMGTMSAFAESYKEDLIIGMASKHTTIDPMEASNTQHNYMFRMVYDTPLHFNNATGEVEPWLATSYDVEEGGKVYIFHLRDDAVFHNGEPLKASDVVFTFNRMPGTTSNNSLSKEVEKVEALDDYTVKMPLTDVLQQDYLRTARAKGLRERLVIYRHALKNALIPIITIIGTQLASVLGGSVLTETVFAWPGVGSLIIDSLNARDVPLVTGSIIMTTLLLSIILLVVDLLYAMVDPRIKAQYSRKKVKKNA